MFRNIGIVRMFLNYIINESFRNSREIFYSSKKSYLSLFGVFFSIFMQAVYVLKNVQSSRRENTITLPQNGMLLFIAKTTKLADFPC